MKNIATRVALLSLLALLGVAYSPNPSFAQGRITANYHQEVSVIRALKAPENTRPPSPNEYCLNTSGVSNRSLQPPVGFLYQPFSGSLSEYTWTSQMDHDEPTYEPNGKLASLGERLRYNVQGPGLAGGTVVSDGRRFPGSVPVANLLSQGFRIFAYQSPSFETYLYYDGHDGHDFAVGGDALAAADGKVVFAGNYGDTLGRVVEIYHPQGYLTRYAHLASFDDGLEFGKQVKVGDPIGEIGGSAVIGSTLVDNHWGVHLHFSVFRWNPDQEAWQITDPFGWDPWAGPDLAGRLKRQLDDPLVQCNGEVSYDLWFGEWPQPHGGSLAAGKIRPTQDRYVGGWMGEDETTAVQPTPSPPSPSQQGEPGTGITRWEYKVVDIAEGYTSGMDSNTLIESNLNRFGSEGWELVILIGTEALMKRPLR